MIPKLADVVYLKSGSPALTVVNVDESKDDNTWVSVTWSCDPGCDREHLKKRTNRTAFRTEVFTSFETPDNLSRGSVVRLDSGITAVVERMYDTEARVVWFDVDKERREICSLGKMELYP